VTNPNPASAVPPVPPPPTGQPSDGTNSQFMRSQLRMAVRMTLEWAQALRYVHGIGWFVWDPAGFWRLDDKETAKNYAVQTKLNAMRELVNLAGADQDALFRDARELDKNNALNGTVSIARTLPPFTTAVTDLDPYPHMINTPDGIWDLDARLMHAHDRAVLHTKIMGCGPGAPHPDGPFHRFLLDVLPDPEVRHYLGKIIGYAAYGKVLDQIFPIITGVGGSGKSTFLDILRAAFGTYGDTAPNSLLMAGRNEHPTEIADLRGQRLVAVYETEEDQRMKVASMKQMTGGDRLKGRRMRQDFFEFVPSHTFLLVTNFPPVLDADDDAAWDRIRVISFDRKFRGTAAENTNLAAEIIATDLPAVVRWVVDGYTAFRAEGLRAPAAVIEATEREMGKTDLFSQFLNELGREPLPGTQGDQLSSAYAEWVAYCKQQRAKPGRKNAFGERLRKRGFQTIEVDRAQVVVCLHIESVNAYAGFLSVVGSH
jgi:putative DNA primase/helicase